MQPVVMAPKILSTKHYGLNKTKEKDNTAEEKEHQRETEERPEGNMTMYSNKESGGYRSAEPRRSSLRGGSGGRGRGATSLRGGEARG